MEEKSFSELFQELHDSEKRIRALSGVKFFKHTGIYFAMPREYKDPEKKELILKELKKIKKISNELEKALMEAKDFKYE